ncbi:MAG: isochorismatase family protein [Deltaproteobacteria bacterium]|nr:isochorismatase family protein [Deltaproteobacteria bacterium]
MIAVHRGRLAGDGVELAYLDTGGAGAPIVFLHGAMGRGASWLPVIEALAPRHRCIAIDQRGHGRSDRPATGYDRERYVGDLARAVDALGLARFALVGHSTGALNAWVYAARHPDRVDALVLEDMHATSRGDAEVEGWRTWLASWPVPFPSLGAVKRYFAAIRPSLGDYFIELFEEHDDGWRPRFAIEAILATIAGNEARDWWPELAAVRCRTLVVKGRASDLALAEAARMAATVPAGELLVIDGASHTVHVDRPGAYAAAVGGFLGAPAIADDSDAGLEARARAEYDGEARIALDPAATALVLIDMQEEFVSARGGPFRVPEAARRVPAMARLLAAFRARGLPVIHTAFARTHELLDRPALGARMPNRGPDAADDASRFEAARFVDELAPLPGEVVVLKPSYGAFYDTPLETILKRLGVGTVVLAGTLTDCCVGTTARQAYERGLGAVVAADATATSLPELHEAELRILRRAFARVATVDAIVDELGPPRAS